MGKEEASHLLFKERWIRMDAQGGTGRRGSWTSPMTRSAPVATISDSYHVYSIQPHRFWAQKQEHPGPRPLTVGISCCPPLPLGFTSMLLLIFCSAMTDYPTDAAKQRKYLFELVVSVPHGTEGPAVLKAAGPCDQGTHLSTSGS